VSFAGDDKMKRAYSQFIFKGPNTIDFYTTSSVNDICTHLKKSGILLPTEDEYNELSGLCYAASMIEKEAKLGSCKHFFFKGDGMRDWLMKCAAPLNSEKTSILFNNAPTKNHIHVLPFMFHFLGGNSPSYLCAWVPQYGGAEPFLFILLGKNQPEPHLIRYIRNGTSIERYDGEVAVVSSALAYIQCFPDTVKDGIPDDLKHQNYYRKSLCKSIGTHHSLIQHNGPSPHYRVGHFRLLSSDKFVHKKGRIIFVHGTFVKGKAATVQEIK